MGLPSLPGLPERKIVHLNRIIFKPEVALTSTRGIKKPAPKAQGAQKKGKRREKRDYFNYIPIYLYLKVYQTVDKNEAVQFISFSLIREK